MDASSETAKEQRLRYRQYHQTHATVAAEWRIRGCSYPPPVFPTIPDDLRGLRCGAKTRAGTQCKLTAIYLCGRCKLHGGMSTGPKTEAGRRQSAENGKKGGRPKKRNLTP